MQKQRLIVQNHEEFTQLVDSSDFRIVRAIVEGALQNINTTKRFIHILTVEVEEEDDIYESFPFLELEGMSMVKLNQLCIGENSVRGIKI